MDAEEEEGSEDVEERNHDRKARSYECQMKSLSIFFIRATNLYGLWW